LVDGPSDVTGVARQPLKFQYLSLTDIKITIPKSARLGTLRKAFEKAKVLENWNKTAWAKKLASKKKRESLTDFDRFKLFIARRKVSSIEFNIYFFRNQESCPFCS
jgi:large subunit ribosomal protein L14e